jgi:hypothetical protein
MKQLPINPDFTRAIMDSHEEPRHYHYSNEADLLRPHS